MITRYRKRYRKLSRWIHRGSIALAAMLWVALAVVLVLLLVPGAEIRNPAPVIALFAASCVAPFIVAGIVESVLSRILHQRFRRYFPRMFRSGAEF